MSHGQFLLNTVKVNSMPNCAIRCRVIKSECIQNLLCLIVYGIKGFCKFTYTEFLLHPVSYISCTLQLPRELSWSQLGH